MNINPHPLFNWFISQKQWKEYDRVINYGPIKDVEKNYSQFLRDKEPVLYTDSNQNLIQYQKSIVDFSAPFDQSNAYPAYFDAERNILRLKAVAICMGMPLYLTGVIIFNTLRIFVVAIYQLIQVIKASCNEKKQQALILIIEIGRSLKNIVRAPLYALGILFAAIYTFIDPYNGRKILSYLERRWNHNIEIQNSGIRKLCLIGESAFYLIKCFQPFQYIYQEKGKWQVLGPHAVVKQREDSEWFEKINTLYKKINTLADKLTQNSCPSENPDQTKLIKDKIQSKDRSIRHTEPFFFSCCDDRADPIENLKKFTL